MNKLDKYYINLLEDILKNGTEKKDRTGTGTISVFGREFRHKMSDGFPLLTTKKVYFKGIVTELLWFLRGETNIKPLVEQNCNIWNGDAYKAYQKEIKIRMELQKDKVKQLRSQGKMVKLELINLLTYEEFVQKIKTDDEFAKEFGELGPIYGKQWRSWETIEKDSFINTDNINDPLIGDRGLFYKTRTIDQIANLINDLKTNPDSRRLIVNAWNVGEIDEMTLPPCHYGFQCYTRELSMEERLSILHDIQTNDNGFYEHSYAKLKCDEHNIPTRALSLKWNQRSVDTALGLPFNIASYGLLLEILAKTVNMVPDELIGSFGDVHIYLNQFEGIKEQIGREYSIAEREKILREQIGGIHFMLFSYDGEEGLHREYDKQNIPRRTREPFKLPTLKHLKSDDFWKTFDVSLFSHLEKDDFKIENYQSHPEIKMPLSN